MLILLLLRRHGPVHTGEVAGFSEAEAEVLIRRGIAKLVDPAPPAPPPPPPPASPPPAQPQRPSAAPPHHSFRRG